MTRGFVYSLNGTPHTATRQNKVLPRGRTLPRGNSLGR